MPPYQSFRDSPGYGAPAANPNAARDARVEYAMTNIDDLSAHGDANRAREQWSIWDKSFDSNCPPNMPYQAEDGSGCVEKPDNTNRSRREGGGGLQNLPGGGGRGGGGRRGGGRRTYGGAPAFTYGDWEPPSYEDATSDPGYQFALDQGMTAMSQSAAARGVQFTGGTMQDLIDYGQEAGAQQYQNVFDRSAQAYGINRDTARDRFAPRYGSWQTQGGWDQSRYLNRQNQIYGALNQPMPQYPGYY